MEALATYIEPVYSFQGLALYRCNVLSVAVGAYVAGERLFCKVGAAVERAAYSHTHVYGRAGARTCIFYRGDDGVCNSLNALRGFEHIQRRHILAAEALGHKGEFNLVARNNFGVQGGGGVVARVLARNGVAYRFAEISVGISAPHAVVYGLEYGFARKADLASYFQNDDGHSRILTDGHTHLFGNFAVFYKLAEGELCRAFAFAFVCRT